MPTTSPALDRASSEPLWSQLRRELVQRIERGDFDSGFPGELELRSEYGVSRHTVRESLRRLREEGVVDSARGRTSRVRQGPPIEQPLGRWYSLFREIERHGATSSSVVRAVDVVHDAEVAAELGLHPDAALVHIERLRLADDEPLAHDRVWLPEHLGRSLLDVDLRHTGLYDELAARTGQRPASGWERIAAVLAPAAEASLLGLDGPVPCFDIERLAVAQDGVPMEYRRTLVRADRYTFAASWGPGGVDLDTGEAGGAPRLS